MFKISEDRNYKHKLQHPLAKIDVYITVESKVHIADMLTKLRALSGFVIVNSKERIERPTQSTAFSFKVQLKYLPNGTDVFKMLEEMGTKMKEVSGITSVKFIAAGDRKIIKDGKPIVF